MTSPNERPVVTLDVRAAATKPVVDLRSMPFANLRNLSDELVKLCEEDAAASLEHLASVHRAPTPYSAAVSRLASSAANLDQHAKELERVAQELIRRAGGAP